MTVTKFPSTLTPIASAVQAILVGATFASGGGVTVRSAHVSNEPGTESTKRAYRIPAGPLGPALSSFAALSGVLLSADPALTQGATTRGLSGDFTREEGLAALLAGTGLEWAPGPGGTYVVQSTALAQATPDAPVPAGEQPVELDPIIVTAQPLEQGFKANMQETATKTPLSIRETPQSVSVITQDSLKARQTQDLGQALETAAGVFQFSGTGPFAGKTAFGFDQITVRGIVLDGYFSVLEDGFISPTFFSKPDLAIYERVEVVKGPSSTLYGRGSPGGLVNRVRKKPLPEFRAEVSASVGSFDTYRLDVDITGPLFASESAGGRMVVAYEDAGAFVDGVESERILAAPSLALDLTDSTRLLLQGTYQEDSFIPNPGFPLVFDNGKFRAPDIRRSLFVGTPNDDENEWELLTGTAQLEQALGDNWPATLKFNRSSQDSQIDLDSYAYGISPTGDVGLYSSAYQFDTDVWSGEVRINGTVDLLNRPMNVTFGADHNDLEAGRNDFYAVLGTANIYDENFDDFPTMDPTNFVRDTLVDNKGTGVYAQLQFRPFKRLDGRFGINTALFRIDRDNVAIPDPTNGPGEFDSISAGLQRSDGFELEINGEPLPGWNLSFGGILLDSEFKDRDDPFFGSTPGGSADWQMGLFSSYELQEGLLRGLGFGVGFFVIDDRGVSTFQAGAELDGYERVDLSAFYNGFKPLKIALQVRNLLDEKYVEGVERIGAYAQFGAPSAVLLTVRAPFGE